MKPTLPNPQEFRSARPILISKAQEFIKNYKEWKSRDNALSFLVPRQEIVALLDSRFTDTTFDQLLEISTENESDRANFIRFYVGARPAPQKIGGGFLHVLIMVGIYAKYIGVVEGYHKITKNSSSFIYEEKRGNEIIHHHFKVIRTFDDENTAGDLMVFDWSLPCPPFGCDPNSKLENPDQ